MSEGRSALHVPAPAERYVDARELADLMGVSVSTIKRFRAAGMPSETWGMRRTRRFLASEAIEWARERARVPSRSLGIASSTHPINDNRRSDFDAD